MKTEIKSKIQKVIAAHAEVKKEYAKIDEAIKEWEKDTIHTPEYRIEKIQQLKQEKLAGLTGVAKLFNKQVNEIVVEEKKAIVGEFADPEKKPADYQVQISNALKFLELAGDGLTDDQAFGILKPFQADYETMQLFQAAIGKLSKGGSFDKTFNKTNDFMKLINSFNVAEKTSKTLFDPMANSLNDAIKVNMFMDSINTIENLANVIDAA